MLHQSAQELLKAVLAEHQEDGTSVTEKGLTVSIKPLRGEKVIFFRTDLDAVRDTLRMPSDECMSCDHLVFLASYEDNYKTEIICFLELKGKNFDHAVEQVCNTYKYIKQMIEIQVDKRQHARIIRSAYICMHGKASAPKYELRGRQKLQKTFGSTYNFKIRHGISNDHELGNFLRTLYSDRTNILPSRRG